MGRIVKRHKGHTVTIRTTPGRAEIEGKWVYDVDIVVPEGAADMVQAFHAPNAYDTEEEAIRQAEAVAFTYIEKGSV